MGLKFKFVTAGQYIDDAAIFTQVINGVSLPPLAPVNLKMYRSVGLPSSITNNTGNIGFEWTRRSRIAPGLRPGVDVPFGEERIRYEVEIMNGETVVRTIFVNPDDFSPVLWHEHSLNFTGIFVDVDERLGFAGFNAFGVVVSKQIFNVGSDDVVISFTTDTSTATSPARIGLLSVREGSLRVTDPNIGFQRATGASVTKTIGLASDFTLTSNANSRLIIKVNRSGQASLHQDSGGQLSAPLGGQTVTLLPGQYWLMVKNKLDSSGGEACTVLSPNQHRADVPNCLYLLTDALADFGGTLPAALTIRVYQVSPIAGRGPYTQATFAL